ncbi:T-cell receptor alpha chain C region [Collichthys lucidus]|nr:T-cell receptor alpha chain C region [Collichthys lucidus]
MQLVLLSPGEESNVCVDSTGLQKILFGSGTRISVETKDVSEPSYYVLKDDDSQVCLASDFSKHDVNKNKELFDGTEPVLMDQLYSQVAFLSEETEKQCGGEDAASGRCEDKLEPDPVVNLMSMTVLGLRLLFLKTLVFNALMTFRLWVSQCEYETIATNPSLSFYKGY